MKPFSKKATNFLEEFFFIFIRKRFLLVGNILLASNDSKTIIFLKKKNPANSAK